MIPLPLLGHEPYNVIMCIIMTLINEALRTPCKSLGHEAHELPHVYEFARPIVYMCACHERHGTLTPNMCNPSPQG